MKKNQLIISGIAILILALIIIAGWFGWKSWRAPQAVAPQAAASAPLPALPPPVQETVEEVMPPGKTVFKCQIDGKTVYTDKPCPSGATVLGTMTLREGSSEEATDNQDALQTPEQAPDSRTDSAACAQLATEISSLNALLRHPQSDAQKNSWQQRLDELIAQQKGQNCSN